MKTLADYQIELKRREDRMYEDFMVNKYLEKDIEKTVKRYAESKGWLTRKWTSPGHMFVPDQIFITPYGHVIFIEFKREGAKPTPGQLREHEKLRNQGCIVYVIDNVNDGKVMVDAHTGSAA